MCPNRFFSSAWILIVILEAICCVVAERSQCQVLAAKVALENQNTIVETNAKRLVGTWLSEGCEIRTGPEYVLRRYTFNSDGTYKLIQHHYWDASCSSPKQTILSTGFIRLRMESMLNPEAAVGFMKPININVTPHDALAARALDQIVARECPDRRWKPWTPSEEHTVFQNDDNANGKQPAYTVQNNSPVFMTKASVKTISAQKKVVQSGTVSCLGSIKWAFNELKLIKTQFRPVIDDSLKFDDGQIVRHELLLGDIHSRVDQREHYSPTSFQRPLLRYIRDEDGSLQIDGHNYTIKNTCTICSNLYASDKSPPHLLERPQLPPYIWGEWVSTRCETRPMGLHLTRKFTFRPDDSSWTGEHKFYQDPFCIVPKFVITAAGMFLLTSNSDIVDGATNIDFRIDRATLTLFNRRMVQDLQTFKYCGAFDWVVGVPQELSLTHGCIQLGILIPSIQNEIVKIEMNYEGSCLLFLGQASSDNVPGFQENRPTAFQEPLMKCAESGRFPEEFGDASYYYDDMFSCSMRNYINIIYLMLVIVIFRIR